MIMALALAYHNNAYTMLTDGLEMTSVSFHFHASVFSSSFPAH